MGASILEVGTTHGTVSDLQGDFSLRISQRDALIEISYLGYKTLQISASSITEGEAITLEEDAQLLDGVVVIGYGTTRESDLSGSVVTLRAEETNRGAVTSPQELLMGKVSGVSILPGDGAPGSNYTLRIRSGASLNASNDPLIVIDGVPVTSDANPSPAPFGAAAGTVSNPLSTLNPNDIATFTVLKDASATAIYGSRASNGVVLITTKKGMQGKTTVTYNSTYSAKDPYKRIEVMGAEEYRQALTQTYPAGSAKGDEVRELLSLYPNASTDWQDEIFQTGLSTDQNIAVAGRAAWLPYRVSFGYNDERGTLETSTYERYTSAINLNPELLEGHLKVDMNLMGTLADTRYADGGAVRNAILYDPTKPASLPASAPLDYNGLFNWGTTSPDGSPNPNSNAMVNPLSLLYDRVNEGRTLRSTGSLKLEYLLHGLEELSLNLNLGYDLTDAKGDDFVAERSVQAYKDSNFRGIGSGNEWAYNRRNTLLDAYANYNKEFAAIDSRIEAMAGYSWQRFFREDYNGYQSNPMDFVGDKEGYTYDEEERSYLLDSSYPRPEENYLVSFFGRVNYLFKERYILTATLRQDGSSRFSQQHRWGTFPSAAVAWSVAEEPFMAGVKGTLSNLKLRASYGITGQQDIDDYLYLTTYTQGTNVNNQYLGTHLLRPNGYSPDLKWEETATFNVGIDYGFINNRINGSIEYYTKQTHDLLNTVSAPAGTNFTNMIVANVGSMSNRGVEFNINTLAISTDDFSWDMSYNLTWNSSEITRLNLGDTNTDEGIYAAYAPYGIGVALSKHQVGYAPYTFWLYQQVYDEAGVPIQGAVVDRNDDGQITEADRYMTEKSPLADFYMGLSSQFTYKRWDLGFSLRASIGNYAYNATAAESSTYDNYSGLGFLTNYSKVPLATTGFTGLNTANQLVSDLFLEDASFLKVDNITLGYRFEKFLGANLSGRLSASVQNLLTITEYSGLDPELPDIRGVDINYWPVARTYTLGLSLNF